MSPADEEAVARVKQVSNNLGMFMVEQRTAIDGLSLTEALTGLMEQASLITLVLCHGDADAATSVLTDMAENYCHSPHLLDPVSADKSASKGDV